MLGYLKTFQGNRLDPLGIDVERQGKGLKIWQKF